jgi:hypothetical protein
MCDWTEAKSANGPALAAVIDQELKAKGMTAAGRGEAFARRMYDWRRGAAAGYFSADTYLHSVGLHPSEVPEHVWRPGKARGPG